TLTRWTRYLDRGWPSVSVNTTGYEEIDRDTGTTYRVTAQVTLGDLEPGDVEVQVVHGAVDLDDELVEPTVTAMAKDGDGDLPGRHRYSCEVDFGRAGNFGFTVRIVPA